jgi:hypothetical protein
MNRLALFLVAALVAAELGWAGGDPWKTKPVGEWSANDVLEVLQNSPWAKTGVEAHGAWRPDGVTQESGSTVIPGSVGHSQTASWGDNTHVSAGATTDKLGGAEKAEAAEAARLPYSIFWWSSRTVRGASCRRSVLKGTMTEADLETQVAASPDEFMILVQSTNMRIFQLRGEKAFESVAYLQMKNTGLKLSPSHVVFVKGSDGQTVTGAIFYFPKKGADGEPTIHPNEKEVDFSVQIADSRLLIYFDPRKMVDRQGVDL